MYAVWTGRSRAVWALGFYICFGWDEPPGFAGQVDGAAAPAPTAYHAMCAREPVLCRHDRLAGLSPEIAPSVVMTGPRRAELTRINKTVNARIQPASDETLYGVADHWTAGRTEGDCEDYVIAKKLALIAAGWSADQLLYAVVEGSRTPFHAVLLVRTSDGDIVLDNLTDQIVPARESGYRFIIRQFAANPYRWVSLEHGRIEEMRTGHIVTR